MPRPHNPLKLQNIAFLRARAQARFRGEAWSPEFTFEVWWQIWQARWSQRGRRSDSWQMVRLDPALPWREDNVEIWNRRDWLRLVNLRRSKFCRR